MVMKQTRDNQGIQLLLNSKHSPRHQMTTGCDGPAQSWKGVFDICCKFKKLFGFGVVRSENLKPVC